MYLLFGVHNHQPVGNFDHVFKRANQDCYRPFIDTLYNFPQIKATLHFSGSLIDWLLTRDKELLQKVKEMVKRQQVEILTGGYYEPILPLIPEDDMRGQVNMLSSFIRDYFGVTPTGIWVGERVWEPQLSRQLVNLGIRYALLDDFHFQLADIEAKDLQGYFNIEEDGQDLAVFPINKQLRYMIPFSLPDQVFDYLRGLSRSQQAPAVTIVDDGEKFGLWPGTHKWVYKKRWLEKFFQLAMKNRDWLTTATISEYLNIHKAQDIIRLPAASYEEMMTWSDGNFRNFLAKYPEINSLHKRMLYVSEQLKDSKDRQAKKYLYQAQCNCPYWHGVFGGIYLKHLRLQAYRNLIKAQNLIEKKPKSVRVKELKLDQELLITNSLLNVFISPQIGGGLLELDYRPKSANLMNAMTRRQEAYHSKIKSKPKRRFSAKNVTSIHDLLNSKEPGLENFLIYDTDRRLSLLDHFLPSGLTGKQIKHLQYKELGDFVNAPYDAKVEDATIILQRDGQINYKGQVLPLRLRKNFSLANNQDAQLSCEYKLENLSKVPLRLSFAVEFSISPESEADPSCLHYKDKKGKKTVSLNNDLDLEDVLGISLRDAFLGVETMLSFEQGPGVWAYPLETISASEQGFERNYQQTVIIPHWPIKLEKIWQTKITLTVNDLS